MNKKSYAPTLEWLDIKSDSRDENQALHYSFAKKLIEDLIKKTGRAGIGCIDTEDGKSLEALDRTVRLLPGENAYTHLQLLLTIVQLGRKNCDHCISSGNCDYEHQH